MRTAVTCQGCDGCQWQGQGDDRNWCQMFGTAPDELPCAQHDKFAIEREIMAAAIRHHPQLLTMMISNQPNP